jgi:signal transduction histidine kinase
MDYLQHFVNQVRSRIFVILLINNAFIILDWWVLHEVLHFGLAEMAIGLTVVSLISVTLIPWVSAKFITEPTKLIWQGILHIAPDVPNVPAPDLKKAVMGRELVTYLVSHVYQLANVVDSLEKTNSKAPHDLKSDFVANSLPLPLMILDKSQNILFANKAMCDYLDRADTDTIGQNVYSVLDMSFGSKQTFDKWLAEAKADSAVSTKTWERVRLSPRNEDGPERQFDLATYYNRSNPEGYETMLVFFDHSKRYADDDQGLSFVALAVHELRSPITMLRGYIEALEEEMDGKLSPEMVDFMHKMKAAAESLSWFINNMLNVSRVESNQLVLKLHEDKWADIVKAAVDDTALRARIMGVEIVTQLNANLPTVGVDRVGIYEVLTNIIDNAIKYSGEGKKVVIKSYVTKDGMVETTIQDFGGGIPANLMPNLFEKFYRSHRSRNQVGGTGLGLYLSKAIVDAHGGKLWVRSKEGQGSTFGFSVQPYAKLADEQKNGDNNDITRGAHGWIKNHSLYSR